MVMDTDNFLRAAKNKDIMTTRRYHCRASILYFLHCNFTRPRKKIVSWVSELHTKKTALWKNLWELGIMSYCWKRNKQLVTRGTLSTKYEKGGLRSALHSCNALWTQQLSTKSKLLRSTWIEKKKLKSIWKNSTCTASIPPSHFFLVIPS